MAYGAGARMGKAMAAVLALSLPAAADEVTIAALGDSLTQGFGLVEEDGFVPQLGRWLAERGHDVTLINAGVSGDTTAGGAARVDWTLTPEVDAMIVALGGNDFLRGIDPTVSRANLAAILETARARGIEVLLIGIVASGNYGADYQRDFNAMYPDLARDYDTLLRRDFFDGLRPAIEAGADVSQFMQADGIHPNARGVALIVETLGPDVETLIDEAREN